MAIMLGGAMHGAAEKLKSRLLEIAAHNLQLSIEKLEYREGDVVAKDNADIKIEWGELVEIAHRRYHDMPDGMEPGLQARHVWEVPTGGMMPTADGRVQMYPCYSFEAHIPLVEIDPVTGKLRYLIISLVMIVAMINPYCSWHDIWWDRAWNWCSSV